VFLIGQLDLNATHIKVDRAEFLGITTGYYSKFEIIQICTKFPRKLIQHIKMPKAKKI
jgi:hypothetical protein